MKVLLNTNFSALALMALITSLALCALPAVALAGAYCTTHDEWDCTYHSGNWIAKDEGGNLDVQISELFTGSYPLVEARVSVRDSDGYYLRNLEK